MSLTQETGSSIQNDIAANGSRHAPSKNRNRNRNRSNNRKKQNSDTSGAATPEPPTTERASQLAASPKQRKPKSNKSTQKSNTSKGNNGNNPNKPLLKELQKILPLINPITINGIPVKNLSSTADEFIEKIINDRHNNDEIFMTFFMKPTDPDFPYDLDLLSLTLCIPQTYPGKTPSPTIMVLNDDIPRGFSMNIETGFKQIVATVLENRLIKKTSKNNREPKNEEKSKQKTEDEEGEDDVLKIDVVGGNDLLGMIQTLDKYLEVFLSMEKKDTIKLVKVMNRKKEEERRAEEERERERQAQRESDAQAQKEAAEAASLDPVKHKARTFELEKFRQRFSGNQVSVFKNNAQGTVYKLCLKFVDDHLSIEFDDSDEINIENLYVKLTVPKDYLNNPKKGLKLLVDLSNGYNIQLLNSIEDTEVKLIFGRLINNIGKNFDIFAADVAALNCENVDVNAMTFWTITSQLNFFVCNIQKFMSEKSEFQNWYRLTKEMGEDDTNRAS